MGILVASGDKVTDKASCWSVYMGFRIGAAETEGRDQVFRQGADTEVG